MINPAPPPSLAALDAALDLLACETFGRLQELTAKFESAAGVKLNDGVVKHRWGEACMRYYLMKSMDDLTCSASALKAHGDNHDEMSMEDESVPNGTSQGMSCSTAIYAWQCADIIQIQNATNDPCRSLAILGQLFHLAWMPMKKPSGDAGLPRSTTWLWSSSLKKEFGQARCVSLVT